jgi:hypothetical protein
MYVISSRNENKTATPEKQKEITYSKVEKFCKKMSKEYPESVDYCSNLTEKNYEDVYEELCLLVISKWGVFNPLQDQPKYNLHISEYGE